MFLQAVIEEVVGQVSDKTQVTTSFKKVLYQSRSQSIVYADERAQGCPTATWPTAFTNAVMSGCRLPSNTRRSG
jgi:hypothetical protein